MEENILKIKKFHTSLLEHFRQLYLNPFEIETSNFDFLSPCFLFFFCEAFLYILLFLFYSRKKQKTF